VLGIVDRPAYRCQLTLVADVRRRSTPSSELCPPPEQASTATSRNVFILIISTDFSLCDFDLGLYTEQAEPVRTSIMQKSDTSVGNSLQVAAGEVFACCCAPCIRFRRAPRARVRFRREGAGWCRARRYLRSEALGRSVEHVSELPLLFLEIVAPPLNPVCSRAGLSGRVAAAPHFSPTRTTMVSGSLRHEELPRRAFSKPARLVVSLHRLPDKSRAAAMGCARAACASEVPAS